MMTMMVSNEYKISNILTYLYAPRWFKYKFSLINSSSFAWFSSATAAAFTWSQTEWLFIHFQNWFSLNSSLCHHSTVEAHLIPARGPGD